MKYNNIFQYLEQLMCVGGVGGGDVKSIADSTLNNVLSQCGFIVGPASLTWEPTLKQHWFNIICLLGCTACLNL